MRKFLVLPAALALALLTGCASTEYGRQGEILGGVIGGVGGAAISRGDPLLGGAIGAGIGAVIGGRVGDDRAYSERDAYERGRRDGAYNQRRYDDRDYRPAPVYNHRCGCRGYYDRNGYFHPSR